MAKYNAMNAPRKFWGGIANRLAFGYHTKYGSMLRSMGKVGLGVGLAAAITAIPFKIEQAGRAMIEANHQYSRFSPDTMLAQQQLNLHSILRDMGLGRDTSFTAVALIKAQDEFERKMVPLHRAYTNVSNAVTEGLLKAGGVMADVIAPIADFVNDAVAGKGNVAETFKVGTMMANPSMALANLAGQWLAGKMFGTESTESEKAAKQRAEEEKAGAIMTDFVKNGLPDKKFTPKPVRFF